MKKTVSLNTDPVICLCFLGHVANLPWKNALTSSGALGICFHDLTFFLCLSRKLRLRLPMLPPGQPHVSFSNTSTTLCQSQKIARIFPKFLLSLKFQIFGLVSPIVKTFPAKSINYRFMGIHFPFIQNKINPYHIRTSCILFPHEKIIRLTYLNLEVRFSFVFWSILEPWLS